VIPVAAVVGAALLAWFARRPLARWRYRRSVERAIRRANFERMLELARSDRLDRETAAEEEQHPW